MIIILFGVIFIYHNFVHVLDLEMDQDTKTASYFPVIARQWSSIVHFKETILRGSEEVLSAQHLSSKVCNEVNFNIINRLCD